MFQRLIPTENNVLLYRSQMTRGFNAKKIVRWLSIILLFVIVVGYAVFRSRDLLFGIRLTITGVTDGMTVTSPILELKGEAHHANEIRIDNQVIPLSETGTWHDSLILAEGYNVILIRVTDKFGRIITDEYRVYYKQQSS
ncbi:MAG: hypothetical protein WCG55_04465 [bacterium]